MKFKKNTTSLGDGVLIDSRNGGGDANFLIADGGGIFVRRVNLATRALASDARPISFAETCFILENGRLELFGEFSYAKN